MTRLRSQMPKGKKGRLAFWRCPQQATGRRRQGSPEMAPSPRRASIAHSLTPCYSSEPSHPRLRYRAWCLPCLLTFVCAQSQSPRQGCQHHLLARSPSCTRQPRRRVHRPGAAGERQAPRAEAPAAEPGWLSANVFWVCPKHGGFSIT